MIQTDVLIVGAGHAGAQCAIALRQQGFEGSVTIIGREPDPPYERPPLSKEYLARDKPFERILLRPEAFWSERSIDLKLGCEVSKIDAGAHTAMLIGGETISYRHLVWAAGGDPRRLACDGAHLVGVHAVRTRADVDRLMSELDSGARRVVVIGGGYIGLEAAAVLTKLGCTVTLLEALPRVLARVAGKALSDFYEAEHRAQGVDLRTEVAVDCIEGTDKVTGVRLVDGEMVPAEIVIVGIGIVPSVGPLILAGATGANGVDVDENCRTSLADVFAIGDCAAHVSKWADNQVIRLESVQNANDMATTAAKAICGENIAYAAFPWFWSNQYDLRLQTAGLNLGHDAEVTRGDPATRSFSVCYLKNGKLIAIDAVNSVKDYVQGRKVIEAGISVSPEQLADTSIALKDLL